MQIDYAGGAGKVQSVGNTVQVHRGFVKTIDKVDHDPVSVMVLLSPKARATCVSRRAPTYDRAALREPERLCALGMELSKIWLRPATVEATSRCDDLDTQVLQALQKCCPRKPKARERKPWLTDMTYQLLVGKANLVARVRNYGRYIGNEKRRMCLNAILQCWNPTFDYGRPHGTVPVVLSCLFRDRQKLEVALIKMDKQCLAIP